MKTRYLMFNILHTIYFYLGSMQKKKTFTLGLGTHLFVKVPWPGHGDETIAFFESSCHLLLTV